MSSRPTTEFVLPALLQKLVGEIFWIFGREIWREVWREICGFFLTHKIKAQLFRGKFRSIFREKFRASKKKHFVPTSFCRRATLRICMGNQNPSPDEKNPGKFQVISKKPLTRVSKSVPGVHGKRGLERGRRKGWRKAGEGLPDFLAPSNFAVLEVPV